MKYKYIVDADYYWAGSGYSHTETIDSGLSDCFITAESWYNAIMSHTDEPLYAPEDGWCILKLRLYSKDADPMLDAPIAESEHCID